MPPARTSFLRPSGERRREGTKRAARRGRARGGGGFEPGRALSRRATPRWCRAWSRHGETGTPSAPTPDRIAAAAGMAEDTETRPTSAGAEEREEGAVDSGVVRCVNAVTEEPGRELRSNRP